jgi:putative endonuclease
LARRSLLSFLRGNDTEHHPTQQIGNKAEKKACLFLKKQGLKLMTRNYRCSYGEIDLIMEDRQTLVFVEVRYRSNTMVKALDTIDHHKQRRIILAAMRYLQSNPTWKACRFDVVTFEPRAFDVEIFWLKDAFQVE